MFHLADIPERFSLDKWVSAIKKQSKNLMSWSKDCIEVLEADVEKSGNQLESSGA